MEREQFTFYQSFAKALSRIKKKSDRCDAYDAIVNYALYGTMPDLDTIAESAALAFELSKPVLDSSRRKAENGKAKAKQTEAKPKQTEANANQNEANRKQTANKKEKEKEGEIEKEKENECSLLERKEKERTEPQDGIACPVLPEEKVHLSKAEYDDLMTVSATEFSERTAGFPERARLQLIGDRYRRRADGQ